MNTRHITLIARKDLVEVSQNRSAWMPMIIVPLILMVVMPLAFLLVPARMDLGPGALNSDPDLAAFFSNMPAGMRQGLEGLDELQSMLMIVLGYLFAPFFLIMPLMFATVIAAESFAGERERKTMEALLYTPASDAELFLGKVLAGLIPAVLISWGSFLLYTLVLNGAGWGVFGRIWFPLPVWFVLILWITPALALLGVSATVLISARTQTFMGAYQSSASLVLVVLGLLVGQATGVLYLTPGVALGVGLLFWLAAAGLTGLAVRSFNRTRLLTEVK